MKTLRFLISLHSGENDFQLAQAKCAEDVSRQLGVHTEIVFAEDDAVNQSTQVVKAIQRPKESRPDAIVLEPVGSIALPQVAKAAIATGIGWAVLNRHPDYIAELRNHSAAPVFSVGADNGEIGRIQGRQFAALLRNGGSVLYIEGPSRSSSAQKRTLGMLETKPPNVQLTLLKANWTAESATRAVSSWLKLSTSQQASIHLVAAQDDAMAMGARKTFEQLQDLKARDRWLALPFTGCDGQPNTGQVWVKKNLLAATIYIAPFTGMAIEILVSALRNGTQPPERSVITPVSFPPLENLSPRKL
jgi:ABC-type sugar transport system substrate-binding protein